MRSNLDLRLLVLLLDILKSFASLSDSTDGSVGVRGSGVEHSLSNNKRCGVVGRVGAVLSNSATRLCVARIEGANKTELRVLVDDADAARFVLALGARHDGLYADMVNLSHLTSSVDALGLLSRAGVVVTLDLEGLEGNCSKRVPK